MGPLRRALSLLRRLALGQTLHKRPLVDDDRVPLKGEGPVRDTGHNPASGRAACGRPQHAPGKRGV